MLLVRTVAFGPTQRGNIPDQTSPAMSVCFPQKKKQMTTPGEEGIKVYQCPMKPKKKKKNNANACE
jgi:hypothetical protein